MNKTFTSGNWYLTISNEKPMTDDGNTYCKFDLIKYKNSFWGCPVNQFGTIEEILNVLKGWKKISEKPEYECIKAINEEKIKMQNEFINILESESKRKCIKMEKLIKEVLFEMKESSNLRKYKTVFKLDKDFNSQDIDKITNLKFEDVKIINHEIIDNTLYLKFNIDEDGCIL